MQLVPRNRDKDRLLAIGLILVVAVTSVIVAFMLGQRAAAGIRHELRNRSESIAASDYSRLSMIPR